VSAAGNDPAHQGSCVRRSTWRTAPSLDIGVRRVGALAQSEFPAVYRGEHPHRRSHWWAGSLPAALTLESALSGFGRKRCFRKNAPALRRPVSRRLVAAPGLEAVARTFILLPRTMPPRSGLDAAQPVIDVWNREIEYVACGEAWARYPTSYALTTSDTKSGPPFNWVGPTFTEEIAIDARWRAHGAR